MSFGETIRKLRISKKLTQRQLAAKVGVEFSYISKIENGKLDFGDVPSEKLICKLAQALDADVEEMLIIADKIPERIRARVRERPDVFRKIATLDDEALDNLVAGIRQNGDSKQRNP